jgi:hypothetical protein
MLQLVQAREKARKGCNSLDRPKKSNHKAEGKKKKKKKKRKRKRKRKGKRKEKERKRKRKKKRKEKKRKRKRKEKEKEKEKAKIPMKMNIQSVNCMMLRFPHPLWKSSLNLGLRKEAPCSRRNSIAFAP